jgi:hypothetical protein
MSSIMGGSVRWLPRRDGGVGGGGAVEALEVFAAWQVPTPVGVVR